VIPYKHSLHLLCDTEHNIARVIKPLRTIPIWQMEGVAISFEWRFDALAAILHPRLKVPMRLVDHLCFVAEHDDHHLARLWALVNAVR
jgi:hypothetical protein